MNENNNNEPTMFEATMETMEVATPIAHTVKRGRGRPAKVEKQIFIDVWNSSHNLNEVAATLGMPRTSVSVKASNLRKTGCELKLFPRGRKPRVAI
tara:strand:- start:143 stop:430 length:288 start_codon:yes stop_codon:yes gene_type:complete